MNPIRLNYKSYSFISVFVVVVYALLTLISLNFVYFWDNIQQISKEAHWFYLTNFSSLLMPAQNSGAEIVATGYHPPLMGIMTAALWKIFGYKLWVSHVFAFVWFLILFYNIRRILLRFFENKNADWVLFIVLIESALLTQFVIASPDFILFTAFIISIRAILEHRNYLLSFGIFFLCFINMRGIFVGSILFIGHIYFVNAQPGYKSDIRKLLKLIIPYLPTLVFLSGYFIYYFSSYGWFFADSSADSHYALPNSISTVIKHLAAFGLRSIENGRVIIWGLSGLVLYLTLKKKTTISVELKFLVLIFILLTGLYLLFAFITQMPFSPRYFMPQFFILTVITLSGIIKFWKKRYVKLTFILIICFELTGHFWIYPEKIAKPWDCTLAHLPYYELRKDCFNYIDLQNIDYKNISGGFCLYGNRQFIELSNSGKNIGTEPNREYFIHSNISNNEDGLALEFNDRGKWQLIKRFEKGYVFIEIYKSILYQSK